MVPAALEQGQGRNTEGVAPTRPKRSKTPANRSTYRDNST